MPDKAERPPFRRPPKVLIPDGTARVKEVARLHRRSHKGFLPPNPQLAGNFPEVTLRRGVEALETLAQTGLGAVPWWLGVGTALGLARERDFLAWDADIDVRIRLDYRDPMAALTYVGELVRHFEARGFALAQESYWEHRPMQLLFADRRNGGLRFDVYVFYDGAKEGVVFNANGQSLREKPVALVDNLARVSWPMAPDIIVNLPNPVEDYLAWRFGPNWRVPNRDPVTRKAEETCLQPLPKITVLTYGTWDGLHYGHLQLLKRCKRMGDHVVVGVVSDELCRIKGKQPVASEDQRLAVIEALDCVDEVFVQRELDQKEKDIDRLGAHFIVVGDDWEGHPRFEQVRGYSDVELVYLSRTPGISSTQLRAARAS